VPFGVFSDFVVFGRMVLSALFLEKAFFKILF